MSNLRKEKQIFLNVICAIEKYLFHGKHSKRSIVLRRYDEKISDKNYFKFCKKKKQIFIKILSDPEHSFKKKMSVLQQYVCPLRKKEE